MTKPKVNYIESFVCPPPLNSFVSLLCTFLSFTLSELHPGDTFHLSLTLSFLYPLFPCFFSFAFTHS
ncbi:hypothetical protein HDV64DRAFT_248679 [Trichoderma sp. TUCIM 5745]